MHIHTCTYIYIYTYVCKDRSMDCIHIHTYVYICACCYVPFRVAYVHTNCDVYTTNSRVSRSEVKGSPTCGSTSGSRVQNICIYVYMVVSLKRGTSVWTPIYYNPGYGLPKRVPTLLGTTHIYIRIMYLCLFFFP